MRKLPILIALLALGQLSFANDPDGGAAAPPSSPATSTAPVETATNGQVTIASRGLDVRQVLHDLFGQAQRNYVIESVPRTELFLSLAGLEFEEALQIVCQIAGLDVDLQNDIYYISKRPQAKPATPGGTVTPPRPRGKLPETVLQKRITTRFSKTDLRAIVADLAKQTGVRIEVSADVPKYLLNAFLVNTSLKFGLDLITKATNLEYKFTDNQSIVLQKIDPNKVTVVEAGAALKPAP